MDVHERVAMLRSLSDDDLLALPGQSEEEVVRIGSRTYTMIVWHDEVIPGVHRFVVTRYDKVIGMVLAGGFVLERNGSRRELTMDELSPFR